MRIGRVYVVFGETSIQVLCPFLKWLLLSSRLSRKESLYSLAIDLRRDVPRQTVAPAPWGVFSLSRECLWLHGSFRVGCRPICAFRGQSHKIPVTLQSVFLGKLMCSGVENPRCDCTWVTPGIPRGGPAPRQLSPRPLPSRLYLRCLSLPRTRRCPGGCETPQFGRMR